VPFKSLLMCQLLLSLETKGSRHAGSQGCHSAREVGRQEPHRLQQVLMLLQCAQSNIWGRITPHSWTSWGLTSFAGRVLVGNGLNSSLQRSLATVKVYHTLGGMSMSRAIMPREVVVSFSQAS